MRPICGLLPTKKGPCSYYCQRSISSAPTFVFGRAYRSNCRIQPQIIIHEHRFGLFERTYMSRVPIEPQRVDAPLTQSATFLILAVADTPDATKTVRSTVASIDDLSKNVSIRDLGAQFACTVGIGAKVWDRVTGLPRPSELH